MLELQINSRTLANHFQGPWLVAQNHKSREEKGNGEKIRERKGKREECKGWDGKRNREKILSMKHINAI